MPNQTEIDEDLEALKNAYQSWIRYDTVKSVLAFKLILKQTTDEYENTTDDRVRDELIAHWLKYFNYLTNVPIKTVFENDAHSIDLFVSFLMKTERLEELKKDSLASSVLAFISVCRGFYCEQGTPLPPFNNVRYMLDKWCGKSIPEDTLKNTASVVDFIYGPACWDLYRNDVDRDNEMPSHLFKLGLPLNGLTKNKLALPTVPFDFT